MRPQDAIFCDKVLILEAAVFDSLVLQRMPTAAPIGYSSRGLSIITGILNPFEYFDRMGKR